jgi:PAS domain S-box-containing protein
MKIFDAGSRVGPGLRDRRLTAINFVADAVSRSVELREIADNALDAVVAVMELDAAAVYIWRQPQQTLELFAWRGLSEAFARQVASLRKGMDPTVDEVLGGATRVVEDFRVAGAPSRLEVVGAGFRSAVMLPVRAHGFVVGMLALGSYRPRGFGESDLELLEVISNQIGIALANAELQADLRRSEEQYRALVENSDDAIFITGRDCRPRFANSAFQKIFGFSAAELAAEGPYGRIHPEDVEAVRAAVERLLAGEPVRNLEYRFCRKDGTWIDLQCSGSVFSRQAGRVEQLQFVVRDVTDVRRRQQQLLRRNRQLAALCLVGEVANSSLQIEQIARNSLEVALECTGMQAGAIHLAEAAQKRLRLYVHAGLPDELVAALRSVRWGEGVTGTVAATGQPQILGDAPTELPAQFGAAARHGFRVLVKVPLKAKGEVLGTLGLLGKRVVPDTREVLEMVTAIGNQLGIAMANARLYQTQLRENEKLNALLDISSGGAQQLQLGSLLQRILEKSVALLRADAAQIVRFVPQTDQAEVVAAIPARPEALGTRFAARESLSGAVRDSRQGRIFSRSELAGLRASPMLRDADAQSALVVPLAARNQLIGAVELLRLGAGASDFGRADLELMDAFASRAAVAIDTAQLLQDLERKNELLQLLVQEAHHRIKNNLQMISGLLQLEAEAAPGGVSTGFLRAAIARIRAIAQVHDMLTEEMPEKVDAHALLGTIVDTLVASAPHRHGRPQVELNAEHLWLNADQAVALALIVNELVANSLLHGRPPPEQPLRVRVECLRENSRVRLTICDNGGGFADEKTSHPLQGQGIKIVAQLARVNLRGELHIQTRQAGVCAELRFDTDA